MTNKLNTVIYTGVTSNLSKRVYEHQNHLVEGFTKRYNLTKFVYYESFDAIAREKQIKGGSRKKKMDLILSLKPQFLDLSDQL
jgi:putative endonuclease